MKSLLLLVACLFLTSCSTVTRGTGQLVNVTSEPADALITIDGYGCGHTPASFMLKRNFNHEILIEKEGYQTQSFLITSNTHASVVPNMSTPIGTGSGIIGNAACGNIFGVATSVVGLCGWAASSIVESVGTAVDLCSGAAYELSLTDIHAELKPIQTVE